MTWKLASLLALLVFALLALGGSVASAQSPDGASHERVQQQRAPAACPPDIQWGCVLSGSASPGLTLNSTSTTSNSSSLYATLTNPGSGSAAVWGRVLGSTSTRGYGLYGSHQGSGFGVYGNSNTGTGFRGFSNTGTGMHGSTNGTGTQAGVLGEHTATSGTGAGLEGRTNSPTDGAVGVLGTVSSRNGGYDSAGVVGINNGTWSVSYGVMGYSASEEGSGVYGVSPYQGVYGQGTGPIGTGVHGWAGEGTGVFGESSSGTAVRGEVALARHVESGAVEGINRDRYHGAGVWGSHEGAGMGVYGTSSSGWGVYGASTSGSAGYFQGDVHVQGDLTVSGSFPQPAGTTRLDHPLDPENQYLSHSFVESPDMMSVYNGNVTLDANGEAVVEMPIYFQALNRDFRYVLTAVGAPGPNLHIAQKIDHNRFKIGGGTPGLEVSWMVTGIRQDPWANENRIEVEEPKPADERGTYLYPEGYGQPESRGVNYDEEQRTREMQDAAPPAPAEAPGQ